MHNASETGNTGVCETSADDDRVRLLEESLQCMAIAQVLMRRFRKFFGGNGSGPSRQTTLAFSSKSAKKDAKEEDNETEDTNLNGESDSVKGRLL